MQTSTEAIVIEDIAQARPTLRVAVVTETWPPEVNGVALSIANVVAGLRARGHQVQLVRPRQHDHDAAQAPVEDGEGAFQQLLLRGMPIPRYPHLRMGLPATQALLRHWSRRRPDIVHIVTEGPLGWSALRAARKLKLPVCSDFRTNFHAYGEHYGLGWLYKPLVAYLRKFHNLTHCTMVPTEKLRAELAALGFRNLQVLARGVDAACFDPAHRDAALRASWGATDGTRVVVHVGRLAPEKNLDLLLTAWKAMAAVDAKLKLVMVGDGPMREALAASHPQVVFAGARRGAELAAHYASGDMFLFPSMTETYGNVTPEALASGLAVLAYDHAAAGQLIRHQENGMLAPLGNAAQFVRLAVRMARMEAADMQHMRARARASVVDMDWPRIVELLEASYRATLAQTGIEVVVLGSDTTRLRPVSLAS